MKKLFKDKDNNMYIALQRRRTKKWVVLMENDKGHQESYDLTAGDIRLLLQYIEQADLSLRVSGKTYSCYLSSQEGHWLHRALTGQMIHNIVIQMNSLPSRPTLEEQTAHLKVYVRKRDTVEFETCEIPTLEEEAQKLLRREAKRLRHERMSHITRIRSLLEIQGSIKGLDFEDVDSLNVDKLRDWDGHKLHPLIGGEVQREQKRYELVNRQYCEVMNYIELIDSCDDVGAE
jgi:hypothetical protein